MHLIHQLCLFPSLCLLSFQIVRFAGSSVISNLARPLNRGFSDSFLISWLHSWLFCFILTSCTEPSVWKHALIQPIPMKGDRSNPSNYCSIALTSTITKVFETLLNWHIMKHIESNSLLSDNQYGFLKARSTCDLLSYITHL